MSGSVQSVEAGLDGNLETIMVVEDDSTLRSLTTRILGKAGYATFEAGSIEESRQLWKTCHPVLALVDLGLPGDQGTAILDEKWVRNGETAVLFLSAIDDVEVADHAFEGGAYGFIVKPCTPNELLRQVKNALRRRHLEKTVAEHSRELERKVREGVLAINTIRSQVVRVSADANLSDEEVVRHLSSAIRLRDDETGRHTERVSLTAAALADWRGFHTDPASAIRLAAAMHDIGKIGIPDWVLLKPGRLTPGERAIVRRHCELGYDLLDVSDSSIMKLAASVALNHHERWDGAGYPNCLRSESIPLEARITSVADVFDALTSDRVYRAALPIETAMDIMVRERNGLFDPDLLDLFIERLDDVLAITSDLSDPVAKRTIRIVIVEQDRVLVEGLTHIAHRSAEIRVVGTACSMDDAISVIDETRPDIVLTGFLLPDGDGAHLTSHILAHHAEMQVIILTNITSSDVPVRCISAGCSGFIAKTSTADELTAAIRRVQGGELAIPPALLRSVVSRLGGSGPTLGGDITVRERELLSHLAEGFSITEIANAMSISVSTARNHAQKVIEKLGAHSKLEAVVIAVRANLVDVVGSTLAGGSETETWNTPTSVHSGSR